ncbi:MAG: hypothetical protein Q4A71_04275 [Actinomycetaceae bacterium]|nr:hypothetical protein [Actinomycetaceae bacterium]
MGVYKFHSIKLEPGIHRIEAFGEDYYDLVMVDCLDSNSGA